MTEIKLPGGFTALRHCDGYIISNGHSVYPDSINELERLLCLMIESAEAQEPVAVINFDKHYSLRDGSNPNWNEMPKVVSCKWLPDGDYPVYLNADPQTIAVHDAIHSQGESSAQNDY